MKQCMKEVLRRNPVPRGSIFVVVILGGERACSEPPSEPLGLETDAYETREPVYDLMG